MLTIMGGAWRGRKLRVPKSDSLRPSAGRVKSSIFSILESWRMKQGESASFEGLRVLDLFAGVGGLGLEALSRGAERCIFVEKDRQHMRFLQENIHSLDGDERSITLLQAAETGAWESYAPFDLVFLDPPYAIQNGQEILNRLAKPGLLAAGALVVFEHDPKLHLETPANLRLHSERKLGPAGLSIFLCEP